MKHYHTNVLREIAKFCTGLVVADIIVGIWMGFGLGQGFPSIFFGIPLSYHLLAAGIVFDIVLLVILIHYAWSISLPLSRSRKIALSIVGVLLAVVAILHLIRVLFGVSVEIGGLAIPMWISFIGVFITGFLSYMTFHFAGYNK